MTFIKLQDMNQKYGSEPIKTTEKERKPTGGIDKCGYIKYFLTWKTDQGIITHSAIQSIKQDGTLTNMAVCSESINDWYKRNESNIAV